MFPVLESIIQSISPSILSVQNDLKLQLAEQIVANNKIQVAEQISVNIHFDISNDKAKCQPAAMITATNVQEESSASALVDRNDYSQGFRNLPFRSGTHVIIDDSSWWHRKDHICIGRLKCIPLMTNEEVIFNGIERESEDYQATFSTNEDYLVFGSDERHIKVYEFGKPYCLRGRSRWTFMEYAPNEVIRFDKLSGLIISLQEKVVRKAIVAKRESESLIANEYYLLVIPSKELEREIS